MQQKYDFLKSVLRGEAFYSFTFKILFIAHEVMKRVLKLCDSDAIIKYLQIQQSNFANFDLI